MRFEQARCGAQNTVRIERSNRAEVRFTQIGCANAAHLLDGENVENVLLVSVFEMALQRPEARLKIQTDIRLEELRTAPELSGLAPLLGRTAKHRPTSALGQTDGTINR